jgi:hypothetical protein
MREALVDVLVDDVRFVQDQIALDQNRHLTVRVHHRDVFRLVEQVDVTNFEVHALFEQHQPATLGERASCAGIQNHHICVSSKKPRAGTRRNPFHGFRLAPAPRRSGVFT